jgi:large subunit ribosomal protein L13e
MTKHNNIIPNAHFKKKWQRYIRTWFDQPSQKTRRRDARETRAKKIAPRPVEFLRPAVRGQTIKYNRKVKAGRGFSLAELREAKISPAQARGIGIAVDHRRRNISEEALQKNVQRLKLYKSKLILFPRHPTSQRSKKGDSSKEDQKAAKQVSGEVLPIVQPSHRVKARKIAPKERTEEVAAGLRKRTTDAKLWGMREKRAKEKAEAAKAPKATEEGGDE